MVHWLFHQFHALSIYILINLYVRIDCSRYAIIGSVAFSFWTVIFFYIIFRVTLFYDLKNLIILFPVICSLFYVTPIGLRFFLSSQVTLFPYHRRRLGRLLAILDGERTWHALTRLGRYTAALIRELLLDKVALYEVLLLLFR